MADETTNVTQNAPNNSEDSQTKLTNNTSQDVKDAPETKQDDSKKEVDLEKIIQKAVDRATNKLGNENKKLREQLQEKLSDEEIKKLELANKEADIADREAKLAEKENRLFAIKAIKEAGLDDGSNTALELVDFVLSDNEDTTRAKVKTFSQLVNKMVSAKVAETFKNNGRNPEKGGTGKSTEGSLAARIGKDAAERNVAANNVLKHYLGGN